MGMQQGPVPNTIKSLIGKRVLSESDSGENEDYDQQDDGEEESEVFTQDQKFKFAERLSFQGKG
jgi:hypothetical protein